MSTYIVEQFVKHANQYEPIENGEFGTSTEALKAKDELESIGFDNLRVVDEEGLVVMFGEWR
ncbi:hypothetical protein ACR2VJ_27435 [Klebsiella pneumoniae]